MPDNAIKKGQVRPGQIAHIDSENRLCIPMDVLRAIEWWKNKSEDLLAELVQEGIVRAYIAAEAEPLVKQLESAVNQSPEQGFERALVLADRYRRLSLYGDGRMQMTKEVTRVLGFPLGERPPLFVQPFPKGFEVMTLEFRNARLARTADTVSISLRFQGTS